MKTLLSLVAVGAAVATVMYLLKDNERVQDTLDTAKQKAAGALDKVKGSIYEEKGETSSLLADLP